MEDSTSYQCFMRSPYRSIKHSSYFYAYDELFEKYRGRDIVFVEIGVFQGGSLFMWRDFFGSKARIIGVDLNPAAKKWEREGFEIFIGNQSDETFWRDFKDRIGEIDIVLDDGGHLYHQQIITCECLLDSIRDGGLLVVEDTHTSYIDGFGDKNTSFVQYAKRYIDKINSRCGYFQKNQKDRRVWSIEIFESIIAFKVNKAASALSSRTVGNAGRDEQAKDFRHHDKAETELEVAQRQEILRNAFRIYR